MSCSPTDFPSSFLTQTLTETNRGVACIDWMYWVHISLAYICVASGLFALISRIIPPLKKYHKYSGLIFMLVMYFTEGSSILIYNTGLPRAIIFFLTLMLVSMTIGFIAIRIHQNRYQKKLILKADEIQKNHPKETVSELLDLANQEMKERPRKWYERLFSFKALHGYFMTLAWYQMAGRAGVTNPFDSWEHCYVYPVYKDLGDNGELVLLPGVSDEQKTQQVLFAAYVTIPALIAFAFIGIVYSFISSIYQNHKKNKLLEKC